MGILPLMVLLMVMALISVANAQGTVVGFYKQICPSAERLVQLRVQKKFQTDNTIVPALLRMHFHDCFVRGCDASLLIDSTSGNAAEKEAGPNQTVRGYEFIDEIKKVLEAVCPNKVSCTDIIALATRDAVALAGGPRYDVPTGRRDGSVSRVADANSLPDPTDSAIQSSAAFALKGLSVLDLVTLLGAHTVGITHCSFFNDRLYNFQGTGKADPTMNPTLVTKLKNTCPDPATSTSDDDPPVNLDQGTPSVFDDSFFKQIVSRRGILQIDQELFEDSTTTAIVRSYAGSQFGSQPSLNFSQQFAQSMVKMGNLGVLTGTQGTIRKNCRVVKL
ncbi:hypothetical protein SUGI_0387110 [Cryptomeria japonica]|uniref:peroxidase 57 n=1 Tax=Cryptomeria japonica TaxID=3369 RepID=UPI002408A4EE|nr:peroxidase 57 [Cryptomeria japonica]GLJ21161.1 hypothetical protein SUGI_0387110 [Cryptomeria japonica]